MSYNVVSNCAYCGAPIFMPLTWHGGVYPPTPIYSCKCFNKNFKTINNNKAFEDLFKELEKDNMVSTPENEKILKKLNELEKTVEELKEKLKTLLADSEKLKNIKTILKD